MALLFFGLVLAVFGYIKIQEVDETALLTGMTSQLQTDYYICLFFLIIGILMVVLGLGTLVLVSVSFVKTQTAMAESGFGHIQPNDQGKEASKLAHPTMSQLEGFVKMTPEGPIITNAKSLSKYEAIALILYALEDKTGTDSQVSFLLNLSGVKAMVRARLDEMYRRGLVFKPTPSLQEFKLTIDGKRWIESSVLPRIRVTKGPEPRAFDPAELELVEKLRKKGYTDPEKAMEGFIRGKMSTGKTREEAVKELNEQYT
jgi:hypothetical protein